MNGLRTVDVLQSQLFILKLLSVCMASRWNRDSSDTRASSRTGRQRPLGSLSNMPDSPGISSTHSTRQSQRSRQILPDHLSTPPGWTEPPPLDDNCARYILSFMVAFLRQTAPPEGRLMSSANLSFEATFHDFESIEVEEGPPPLEFFDEDAVANGSASKAPKLKNASSFPALSGNSGTGSQSEGQTAPIPQLTTKIGG